EQRSESALAARGNGRERAAEPLAGGFPRRRVAGENGRGAPHIELTAQIDEIGEWSVVIVDACIPQLGWKLERGPAVARMGDRDVGRKPLGRRRRGSEVQE